MKYIELSRNPAGRLSNFGFGLASILDGLVRTGSLGFLHSRFTVEYARRQAQAGLRRAKRMRG